MNHSLNVSYITLIQVESTTVKGYLSSFLGLLSLLCSVELTIGLTIRLTIP